MEDRTLRRMASAVILIVIGSLGMAYGLILTTVGAAIMTAGVALLIVQIFRMTRKRTDAVNDERVKKINAKAMSWSYMVTMVNIGAMALADVYSPGTVLVGDAFLELLIIMGTSLIIFQTIFMKRGDVE